MHRRMDAPQHEQFNPSVVVRRDSILRGSRWKLRIDEALLQESQERRIPVRYVPRHAVKKAFLGHDGNKHEIATVLAQRFPALAPKLPPKRKIWQSEDYRMSVFDAAALGVAYFARHGKGLSTTSGDGLASSQSARWPSALP
jgi:hypothetical protein